MNLTHGIKRNGLKRLVEILPPPLFHNYNVNSLLLQKKQQDYDLINLKEKSLGHDALLNIINEEANWPMLICFVSKVSDYGWYAYIDSNGKLYLQTNGHRRCGRYFLRQFLEDAIRNSVEGTGSFEVVAAPPMHGKEDHVTSGWISHYYTKANSFFRHLTGLKIDAIGIQNKWTNDDTIDRNGNRIPIYRYKVRCSLLIVRPVKPITAQAMLTTG